MFYIPPQAMHETATDRRAKKGQSVRANGPMPPPAPRPKERKNQLYLDVGQRVFTPYGQGQFCHYNYRTGVYKIDLDWKLADNKPASAFLQASELRKVEKSEYYRGQNVVTAYGIAKVIKFRPEDLIYELQLPWRLANDKHALAYMLGSAIKAQTVLGRIGAVLAKPKYKDTPTQQGLAVGTAVDTVFGVGKVVQQRVKDSVYEVELLSHGKRAFLQQDQVKKRTVFAKIGSVFGKRSGGSSSSGASKAGTSAAKSAAKKPSNSAPGFQVDNNSLTHPGAFVVTTLGQKVEPTGLFANGAAVVTSYGLGKVIRFRGGDGVYEVELTLWKLATGKPALAFLQGGDLKKQTVAHKV
jgi:hypothetical protein